jgi:hypothetical protein
MDSNHDQIQWKAGEQAIERTGHPRFGCRSLMVDVRTEGGR